MNAATPTSGLPTWEFRCDDDMGPSVWAAGRGLVARANSCRDEDYANMRRIAALPRVLEELGATSSCLQAVCLIVKDPEARKLAMQQVAQARSAIAQAMEQDS